MVVLTHTSKAPSSMWMRWLWVVEPDEKRTRNRKIPRKNQDQFQRYLKQQCSTRVIDQLELVVKNEKQNLKGATTVIVLDYLQNLMKDTRSRAISGVWGRHNGAETQYSFLY